MAFRGFLKNPRALDAVVVALATALLIGAYVTAYAYVKVPGRVLWPAAAAGFITVEAAWLLLTLFLFAAFAAGLAAEAVRPTPSSPVQTSTLTP